MQSNGFRYTWPSLSSEAFHDHACGIEQELTSTQLACGMEQELTSTQLACGMEQELTFKLPHHAYLPYESKRLSNDIYACQMVCMLAKWKTCLSNDIYAYQMECMLAKWKICLSNDIYACQMEI